jgi:peroxiredoxin
MDDKRGWQQPDPTRNRRIFAIVDPIIAVGEDAPIFKLSDFRGDIYSFANTLGKIIVLNFWSAECTWCERLDHELMGWMDCWKENVKVLWIASNANESRSLIESVAPKRNLPTVLLDENQQVADLYGAEMTPHFFIVDTKGKLAYRGAWDDISFRQRVATRVYVPEVIERLMQGLKPRISQTPPFGCIIVRFTDQDS